MVPILVLRPYWMMKSYERSRQLNQIVESLAQGSRDLQQMSQLMEGPVEPWTGVKESEELRTGDKPDLKDFLILQDLRIIDLRSWKPLTERREGDSFLYGYRRLKVQKRENATNNQFRVSVLAYSPATQIRFPEQQLSPKLYSRG